MDEPRSAATVVLARDTAGGPEVLFVRRGGDHRFLPGFVAFPGGAVDPGDSDLAVRWFGDASEAPRACAVRELAEEVGVALTGSGHGSGLEHSHADPPPASSLVEISRWVAPESVPVRFDARFFAVAAPEGLEPVADGGETERCWWARPDEVLGSGEHSLYVPTRAVLEALARCADVVAILAARIPQSDEEEPE